jgi:hypothetical protein
LKTGSVPRPGTHSLALRASSVRLISPEIPSIPARHRVELRTWAQGACLVLLLLGWPIRGYSQNVSGNAISNFGSEPLGQTLTQPVVLTVNSSLSLTSVTASGDYSVVSDTCSLNTTLAAGTMCTLDVAFEPTRAGNRWFTLTVATSSGTFTFGLAGIGLGPVMAITPGIMHFAAGTGSSGYAGDGAAATSATFTDSSGATVDSAGNIYIADTYDDVIRVVNRQSTAITAYGVTIQPDDIATVAGTYSGALSCESNGGYSGDNGSAISAELFCPSGVAIDPAGNLYIADSLNNVIRKVNPAGTITTAAGNGTGAGYGVGHTHTGGYTGDGGAATSAELFNPLGVATDSAGNLYIADSQNNAVRVVNTQKSAITLYGVTIQPGDIETVAGTGTQGYTGDGHAATAAELYEPYGMAVDPAGNLDISDSFNFVVRRVNSSGTISTVAGNGTQGSIGNGGAATGAEFNYPAGIYTDAAGDFYVSDLNNDEVRKVDLAGIVTNVAGDGESIGTAVDGQVATGAPMAGPNGVAADGAGNLYIVASNRVFQVNVSTSLISFGSVTVGQTGTAQSVVVSDVGNAALSFTAAPSVSTNFTSETVGNDCANGSDLTAGTGTCNVGVASSPTVTGPTIGTAMLSDNAFNSPQTIDLTGGGSAGTGGGAPTLTALSQYSATAGSAGFTLTLTGTNFISTSVAQWNGAALTTTYVSATSLTAVVPMADLASAATVSVTVFNSPSGGTTSALTFDVNNPVPTLTSLSQNSATAGSAGFTLTLTGTNFIATSIAQWNGAALSTTYVSATSLTAIVPAGDLAAVGTASVTVFNPTPGGGTSTPALAFAINNPLPSLTMLSQNSATAGSAGFTLTLTGTNFISSSVAQWNGTALSTTYVSSTSLTAVIPTGDLAEQGSATVTVFNPTPGGGTSGGLTFTINAAVGTTPTLTSLSPSFAIVGGAAFTLTANGTNFISTSVVQWNGTALTTTYVSATQLTASVPASDIATAGTASVTVFNPTVEAGVHPENARPLAGPPGTTSNALTFDIVDFSVSSTTPSESVSAGGSATFAITTASVDGTFPNSVTFTVSGLPTGAAAMFSPTSVTPGAGSTMTVTTLGCTAGLGALPPLNRREPGFPTSLPRSLPAWLAVLILAILLAGVGYVRAPGGRPMRRLVPVASVILLIVTAGYLTGCAGGFPQLESSSCTATPSGSHAVTVTGTSGSDVHTTTVTLIVGTVNL